MAVNPIIYIDGELADAFGGLHVQALANLAASMVGKPVDVLTHGASKFHGNARFVGEVKPKPDAIRHVSEFCS